jgi:hypothetical protein
MARSPRRRYGSVQAFLQALREASPELRDAAARPAPKAGRASRTGAATPRSTTGRKAEKADQDDDRRTSTGGGWWRRLFGRGGDGGS